MSTRSYQCETCGASFTNGNLARAHAAVETAHTFTETLRRTGKSSVKTGKLTLTNEEFQSRSAAEDAERQKTRHGGGAK